MDGHLVEREILADAVSRTRARRDVGEAVAGGARFVVEAARVEALDVAPVLRMAMHEVQDYRRRKTSVPRGSAVPCRTSASSVRRVIVHLAGTGEATRG